MITQNHKSIARPFLWDGGEMGRLTREYDWSSSPLGTPETWPIALGTTLGILLHAKVPMFLWWGQEHIQFYNDAYRPSLGDQGKHPKALGQRGEECWPEIWPTIHPLMQDVLTTGIATYHEDMLVPIFRNGTLEDVYWTFGYSPVIGDTGMIDGVLVVCTETTQKVLQDKLRTQAYLSVQESEERFRTMAEVSTILIAMGDAFGHANYFNQSWAKFTGRPVDDLLSLGWADLVHPEDQQRCLDIYNKALLQKTAFSWEFRVQTGDGKYRWLLTNAAARFTANGDFEGHISSSTDISDLKEAEQALRNSERQVRDLVESASFPIGVYIGPELKIMIANHAILKSWGRKGDVIGKPLLEVLPELGQEILDELRTVYTSGIPFHRENIPIQLGRSGRKRTLYFNYSFIPVRDEFGQVYGVMATGADVTDLNVAQRQLEESEKNIRNTILRAPVAICILRGPHYFVEIANDRMLELWGVGWEQVLHKPIFEGLPEVRDQGFEALLDSVYHEGQSVSIQEHPITLPRKGRLSQEYVSFLYEPEITADGNIIGVLAVATIVTDAVRARHQIEDLVEERTHELEEANQHLERSNAELRQFAYIASHDLQEPIRKINIYIGLLADELGTLSERSIQHFTKIKSAGSRMSLLVRDILAYSELSREALDLEPVDLNRTVSEILSEFDLLIEQSQAQFHVGKLPTLPAIPLQMQQLFSNLLSNALKYVKPGVPPIISITCTLENGFFHITISDNGIGFSPEHANQIFSIFQRLHGNKSYSGTGIGLSICQKITANHNGSIYAVGNPGEGAEFHVLLPASEHKNIPVVQ